MPHFWCGVMKLSTICFLPFGLRSITGLTELGVDRRPIDAEALAEGPHPQVVLVELLAAGQRAPRDQLVHVGVAGVVADLLRLSSPDQIGEEMILRGCATTSRKRIFSSSFGTREMGVLAAGEARRATPRP